MSRGSKLRRQAMQADVTARAYYALNSGDGSNPFLQEDPRHQLFSITLARARSMDAEAKDLFAVYGMDEAQMPRRHHKDPGPVRDVAVLVEELLNARELAHSADLAHAE